MARTKRNSLGSRIAKRSTGLSKQEAYRCLNGKWHLIAEGEDIMVQCTEDDIRPDRGYYMINVMRPHVFYECHFSALVQWDTIQMLLKYNRIWQLKEKAQE